MSVFLMASGRLKSDPRLLGGKITATLIANDSSNRSQKITLETTDSDVGRALQKAKEGESVSVSGELTIIGGARLHMRPRTVQRLAESATPEPSE
jgi:vacuolar-type H+-ATPase subunit E/Vma4